MELVNDLERQLEEKTKKEQNEKERREKQEAELISALQKQSRYKRLSFFTFWRLYLNLQTICYI